MALDSCALIFSLPRVIRHSFGLAESVHTCSSMAVPDSPEAVVACLEGCDILAAALAVLREPDPHRKAALTELIVPAWRAGRIRMPSPGTSQEQPPDRPARDETKVRLVPAKDAPKRGKGGSLASRQAMLHSLVHIENCAVDLAWDAIARFGGDASYRLPRDFFDDFVTVAADECRHFLALEQRLEAIGSHYGALAAHDGLWESAAATAGSLGARLAVEHCTHEARGLDVLPQTVARFRAGGDADTAELLQDVIYVEEISHCAAGVRWLKHLHQVAHDTDWGQAAAQAGELQAGGAASAAQQQQQPEQGQQQEAQQHPAQQGQAAGSGDADQQAGCESMPAWAAEARRHARVEEWFHALVRAHFFGPLKPPFNEEARAQAGFGPEWYLPLAAARDAGDAGGGTGKDHD
ncbi:hypothetical protein ABPG77_007308 [Micractinium sp. CCAP 211/92]